MIVAILLAIAIPFLPCLPFQLLAAAAVARQAIKSARAFTFFVA